MNAETEALYDALAALWRIAAAPTMTAQYRAVAIREAHEAQARAARYARARGCSACVRALAESHGPLDRQRPVRHGAGGGVATAHGRTVEIPGGVFTVEVLAMGTPSETVVLTAATPEILEALAGLHEGDGGQQ